MDSVPFVDSRELSTDLSTGVSRIVKVRNYSRLLDCVTGKEKPESTKPPKGAFALTEG